jgi:hypothetical protein
MEETFDALIEMIMDTGEFEVTRSLDEFHPKGTVINFEMREGDEEDETLYLRGRSTHPEVGEDTWQVLWILDGLSKSPTYGPKANFLTSGDPDLDSEIIQTYERWLEETEEWAD